MVSHELHGLRQPLLVLYGVPATSARHGVSSSTSFMGRTSTFAPHSVSVLPIASATPAVDPARVEYAARILFVIVSPPRVISANFNSLRLPIDGFVYHILNPLEFPSDSHFLNFGY